MVFNVSLLLDCLRPKRLFRVTYYLRTGAQVVAKETFNLAGTPPDHVKAYLYKDKRSQQIHTSTAFEGYTLANYAWHFTHTLCNYAWKNRPNHRGLWKSGAYDAEEG